MSFIRPKFTFPSHFCLKSYTFTGVRVRCSVTSQRTTKRDLLYHTHIHHSNSHGAVCMGIESAVHVHVRTTRAEVGHHLLRPIDRLPESNLLLHCMG